MSTADPLSEFRTDWEERVSFEIFTSGSTGKPKKVLLSPEQLIYSAEQTERFLSLGPETRIFNCISPEKIGGFMNRVRAMVWNCELFEVEPSADPLTHLKEDHPFTFVSLVPFQLGRILNDPISKNKLDRFEVVLLGGSPLHAGLRERLKELRPHFYESYGMTETCSHIGLRNAFDEKEGFAILGDVQCRISVDDTLILKGTVTAGREIQTTDIVSFTNKGRLVWKGRADFVINSGGIKLHPEEIESRIYDHFTNNDLPDFILTGLSDAELGERMVLVSTDRMDSLDLNFLARYERPKQVIRIDEFPLTSSGKIDRKKTADLVSLQA